MKIDDKTIKALETIDVSTALIQLIQEALKDNPEVANKLLLKLADANELLKERLNLDGLDKLEGKTPERGVDYFTPEEIQGLQDFITANTDTLGANLTAQLENALVEIQDKVQTAINNIPVPKDGEKGEKGDKGDPGKDGSPDTPEQIAEKLKKVRGAKRLSFKNVKGLTKLATRVKDNTDRIDDLEKNTKEVMISVGSGSGSGGGGATTFTDLTDTPADYSGKAGEAVRVKSDESGLEYYQPTDNDEHIKISATDNSAGYLEDKLQDSATANILKQSDINNNESLTVDVKNTDALWNADKIQGRDVAATAPTTNQVLKWDGSKWKPQDEATGGGGDMLKSTYDTDNSGVVDDAEKLNNQAGSYYLDRANHTGTQTASTISDFDTEVSNNTDVSANTSHRTNTNNPHNVTKAQVGLSNVDNTSDLDKPVSTATQSALDGKVDKVTGKGLSTNDYDNTAKGKVDNISVTQPVDLDQIESDTNANNAKRHDPVTVTDTDDIDLTLTGQDIKADLKSTSINTKISKTVTGPEEVLINDGGTLKKTTAQDIANLGGGGSAIWEKIYDVSGDSISTTHTINITAGTYRILKLIVEERNEEKNIEVDFYTDGSSTKNQNIQEYGYRVEFGNNIYTNSEANAYVSRISITDYMASSSPIMQRAEMMIYNKENTNDGGYITFNAYGIASGRNSTGLARKKDTVGYLYDSSVEVTKLFLHLSNNASSISGKVILLGMK